jgi:hypothetical protein
VDESRIDHPRRKDCASCHAAEASHSVSGWSKATKLHAAVANVTTCRECHGLTNGNGSTVGTSNNLPVGLTNSAGVTSASTGTGVPSGTHDQISYADINITANDCNLCHTQQGPSTASGIQGKEWAQASFHQNFSATTPLVLNGGTGRCSNCHLNVKPTAVYTQQDHSAFTATSPQDCSGCHSWPGNNAGTPNWLGAKGAHASSGSTVGSTLDCNTCHGQGGSSSMHLGVPAANHFGGIGNGNTCISCHADFSGFSGTVTNLNYPHTNATANAGGCEACHSFANQLYTTMTTTPLLTHPTTAGGHQFSQTQSVDAGRGGSFPTDHRTPSWPTAEHVTSTRPRRRPPSCGPGNTTRRTPGSATA